MVRSRVLRLSLTVPSPARPAPCECSTTPPGQLSLCWPSLLSISPSAEGRAEELEAPWTGHSWVWSGCRGCDTVADLTVVVLFLNLYCEPMMGVGVS